MNKAEELKNVTALVKSILRDVPATRNSDMVLYTKVMEKLNPEALNAPFRTVITNLKEYNLPCIESVGRARRKIQSTHPELAADSEVEAQRFLNEETFRDYARKQVQA